LVSRLARSFCHADAAVPARGNKERNAACHVRLDLSTQRPQLLSVERPQEQRQDDQIQEDVGRCFEALRRES